MNGIILTFTKNKIWIQIEEESKETELNKLE